VGCLFGFLVLARLAVPTVLVVTETGMFDHFGGIDAGQPWRSGSGLARQRDQAGYPGLAARTMVGLARLWRGAGHGQGCDDWSIEGTHLTPDAPFFGVRRGLEDCA